ncbi:hypothetical protein VaNZ11_008491 [Volvox africanus]|uniref:Uncharacterized protein n=1 Tax=Volvox africanus TaxID=51714 RepID=A0ABQ5S5A1_9CHLO|nr:hypothetical protein VaNZ11_008491 [Volvox africanus]
MASSIILTTLFALVASSVRPTYDVDPGTRLSSKFRGQATTAAVERRLQATTSAHQCLWTRRAGCELNADFVTTLSGSPTTESQKLLARNAALSNICTGYNSSYTCLAKPGEYCVWSSSYQECYLGTGYIPDEWLQSRLWCSGSLAETTVKCVSSITSSTCSANAKCVWAPTGLTSQASSIVGIIVTAILGSSNSSCVPKWATDEKVVNNLVQNAAKGTTVAEILAIIFNDLMGTCSSAQKFKTMLTTCPVASASTCLSTPGCAFQSNACNYADDFPVYLLLNQTDTWVVAWNKARVQCEVLSSNSSCSSSPDLITINKTLYSQYLALQPSFPPEPNVGSLSGPTTAILLGLFFSILHLFLFYGKAV